MQIKTPERTHIEASMQIKAAERTHIENNRDAYWAANDRAMLALKADRRLTGLTKTRDLLAHYAALEASGFNGGKPRSLIMTQRFAHVTAQFQGICEEALEVARLAARGLQVPTPQDAA